MVLLVLVFTVHEISVSFLPAEKKKSKCNMHTMETPLNGHPRTADTHDIVDNSEYPDCLSIHFNTQVTLKQWTLRYSV